MNDITKQPQQPTTETQNKSTVSLAERVINIQLGNIDRAPISIEFQADTFHTFINLIKFLQNDIDQEM
jgi:hypothetical protein